jgi:hypothetical protein
LSAQEGTGDVLRVTCPLCHFRNEFPELDMVSIFLCQECGSGFPYSHDQWISANGTAWAANALALSLDGPSASARR